MRFKAGQQARVSPDSLYFPGLVVEVLSCAKGYELPDFRKVAPVSEPVYGRRTALLPTGFLEPLDGAQGGPQGQEQEP